MTTFDLDNVRWRPARNDETGDINPRAVVHVTSFDKDTGEFVVSRPTADNQLLSLAVNYVVTLPAGSSGLISFDWPNWARYSGASPSAGAILGTEAGDDGLKSGKFGFRCLCGADTPTQSVMVQPGGANTVTFVSTQCVDDVPTDTSVTLTFMYPVVVEEE